MAGGTRREIGRVMHVAADRPRALVERGAGRAGARPEAGSPSWQSASASAPSSQGRRRSERRVVPRTPERPVPSDKAGASTPAPKRCRHVKRGARKGDPTRRREAIADPSQAHAPIRVQRAVLAERGGRRARREALTDRARTRFSPCRIVGIGGSRPTRTSRSCRAVLCADGRGAVPSGLGRSSKNHRRAGSRRGPQRGSAAPQPSR
jgi:hypothetical protein